MKKISGAAVAAVALVSAPAFAADSTESFDITASVPESCLMENINDVDLGEVDIVRSSGEDALLFDTKSLGNTGAFYVSCNLENQLSIQTQNGGLTNQTRSLTAADDATFTDTLEYRIRLDNYFQNGDSADLDTRRGGAGYTTTTAQRGAIHRQVTGRIILQRNGDNENVRPLAGDYEDTVTVTVFSV